MKLTSSIMAALMGVSALVSPALAQPAATAAEHRLNAQEIRDLAKREVLWCDDYSEAHDDCDALTLVRLSPDGKLVETTTMLISESPRLQAYIGDIDEIRDDRVCSKVAAATTPLAFTIEGKAVPAGASAGLKAILLSSLAELDGKTVCQSFFRGSDPMVLREEVTVDGARRTDLETTYVLREPAEGFALRAQVHKDEPADSHA